MCIKNYFAILASQNSDNYFYIMTKNKTIDIAKDAIGTAVKDYYKYGRAKNIRVFSSHFDEDEIPTRHLFRKPKSMNKLERKALQLAHGHILDVGAGCGCHSLALQRYSAMNKTLGTTSDKNISKYQKHNFSLKSIDVSPLCVEVMRLRGIKNAQLFNFFDIELKGQFDTILMLMNGIGIVQCIGNLPLFFKRLNKLLAPEGIVYFDSSDLRYLYEEEDGSFNINLNGRYYGEIDYVMRYKDIESDPFNWLYIDFETLSYYAQLYGFKATKIMEGEHYDYLASLEKIDETKK